MINSGPGDPGVTLPGEGQPVVGELALLSGGDGCGYGVNTPTLTHPSELKAYRIIVGLWFLFEFYVFPSEAG